MPSLWKPIWIPVRVITDGVNRDISKAINGSRRSVERDGESLGQAFSRGFNKGVDVNSFQRVRNGIRSMVPEADAAIKSFHTLTRTAHTLGTALPVLAGGLSSVVGGLFALIGAGGGAISTVTVLGNGLFALGAGMIASRLALSGVGKALTTLHKQNLRTAASGTQTALQAVRDSQAREAATKRIEDAERSLARVIESNAERIAAANQDIVDAQSDVTRAIRDGREELQQLGFDAEDAALNEKKASLELEKARETLARVQDLPPNDRARRAAELAYEEAEFNYRKAKDANSDLAKEQDRLSKSGVNGLQSVIDARKKLADAEQNKSKTVKDALQSEEDALRDVADARKAAQNVDDRQEAAPAGGAAAGGLGPAWDAGLNEAQKNFVRFLNGLRPKLDELKKIAANALLPQLQTAIQTLVDKAYPSLARGIGIVADAMGGASITLANIITESGNISKLNNLFDSSGRIIKILGNSFGRVYDILLSILNGAAPMAERFFGFIDKSLGNFAAYLNSVEGNKALTQFFADAEYTAKLFGDALGAVFGSIGRVIQANIGPNTGGGYLLEWIKTAFDSVAQGPDLQDYFLKVAVNATKIMDALGGLVGIFKNLAANENLGKTFDTLQKGLPALENILTIGVNAGPSLANLVVTITDIVSALSDTGAMKTFFDTLNNIFTVVKDWVSAPENKKLLDTLGRMFAVFSAISFVGGIASFSFKAIAGGARALLKPFSAVASLGGGLTKTLSNIKTKGLVDGLKGLGSNFDGTGKKKDALIKNLGLFDKKMLATGKTSHVFGDHIGGLGTKFGGVAAPVSRAGRGFTVFGNALKGVFLGPVGIALGVIAALVGLFILLYNTNDDFKKQMDAVWADLSKTFAESGAQIMDALKPLVGVFSDLLTALAPVIATLISSLVPVISTVIKAIVPLVTALITGLVPVFKMVADILTFVAPIIAAVLGFIVTVLAEVLKVVITVITAIVTWIIDSITNFGTNWNNFWTGIGQFFSDMWNGIVQFVSDFWDGLMGIFKGAMDILLDWFLNWTIYGIIISHWNEIVAFFQDVWNNVMGFFDAAFKWIDQFVLQPMGLALKILGDVFANVGKFIGDVWANIQTAINIVWKWIDANIFKPIRDAMGLVGWAFQQAGGIMADAWGQLQDSLDAVWKWIDSNVFTPIKNAVGLVQDAFENAGDGIAKAWDGIKQAAAIPVNFVIDTVYNNGLRSFWNDIADKLNMKDLKLPKAKTVAFASGGVLPGYSPGKDIHKFYSPTAGYLHLSGGEAIMRPEWTRMMGGPAAIARMNRAAMRGQKFATGGVYGGGTPGNRRFASGGILDWAGDVLEGIGNIGKIVGDFFSDPAKAVQTHIIDGVIKPLLGGGGDSMFEKLVGGIPIQIANGINKAISALFGGGAGSDSTKGFGMGWEAMWKIVSNQFPWAHLNSSYRAGAKTATGSPSYHGLGRAIDVNPSMDIFNFLARAFPNSKELIYSPANKRQLQNGKQHLWGEPVRSMHFNHVHWAMANGGTVYPSPDGTIVRVAEAGKPERVEPLDPNGLSDRDKALIDHLTTGGGVTINVYQQANEDGEALARRVSELISHNMRKGALR